MVELSFTARTTTKKELLALVEQCFQGLMTLKTMKHQR
jgi:hypothetical protein